MSEKSIDQCGSLLPLEEELPIPYEEITEDREKIQILETKRRITFSTLIKLWKYITLIVAFASIFICIAFYLNCDEGVDNTHSEGREDISDTMTEDTEAVASPMPPKSQPLTVINEAVPEFELDEYVGENFAANAFFKGNSDIMILLIHSHSSEYISENISVLDAGNAISQLINSAGILSVHSTESFDTEGKVGAYDRMKNKVIEISSGHEGNILVIDLHSSDSGADVTFTVGADPSFGWRENLRCAITVAEHLENAEVALRLLPSSMGQDSGILTLNVGIGGKNCDDETARGIVSALVKAILNLYNEDPRNVPGIHFMIG